MLMFASGRAMDEPVEDIKAEIEQLDLLEEVQVRLDDLEKKYEQLKTYLIWGLGGLITMFFIFR